MSDSRPLFMIGFMASGKTTAGRELARKLSWDFLDLDQRVEQRQGRSVSRIFADSGEQAFRAAEWEALRTLAGRARCVVATGGGVFQERGRRRWIRSNGHGIWLDVPLHVIRTRLAGAGDRPLWLPDDPGSMRELFERRRAAYALAETRVVAWPGESTVVAARVLRRVYGREPEAD